MTARQKVVGRYLNPGGCGQTARERNLRLRPSHLRFGLTFLFVALVFLGRSFEPSPTAAVSANVRADIVHHIARLDFCKEALEKCFFTFDTHDSPQL